MNNKPLEQDISIKYTGVIIDWKFKFRELLIYENESSSKIIQTLSESTKLIWT